MSEHIVKSYEEQLQNLTNTIVKMGGLAESQFASSVNALLKRDEDLADKIAGNAKELLTTLVKLKPQAAKGVYIKSIHLSSTMSPSIEIDSKRFAD